jgi:hypothetical protein
MTETLAVDRIEEAKSGRSRCRACGVAIEKGELRFGQIIVECHDFMEWFHLACAQARSPERLAPVLAASKYAKTASLDSPASRLVAVERAKGRAGCHACERSIAPATLRVAVRLDPDPANPQYPRKGFIHLACASAFTGGADVDAHLAKRAAKLPKAERETIANVLAAVRAVAGDPRGKELAALASAPAAKPKKPRKATTGEGALSVFGDWLEEEHEIVLAEPELSQVAASAT